MNTDGMGETPVHGYTIWVGGKPVEKGSKTAGKRKDGSVFVRDSNSKQLVPWSDAVKREAEKGRDGQYIEGPVAVDVVFLLTRPKDHYGTGRNSAVLKPDARPWPTVKPDIDKLLRSILDSLTNAGCFTDDCYVVQTTAIKMYGPTPGAQIRVRAVE